MTKRQWISLGVAFILSNVLTTIYYMITDKPNWLPFRKEEINFVGMMANHIIYVGVMVFTFPRWYRASAGSLTSQGILYGVLMSAIMFLPQACVVRSIWQVEFNTIFVINTTAHLVIGAILGAVMSMLLKKDLVAQGD